MERLGASHFGLGADVRCPERTPYTCFLDGIQFSTGCTMGKGNIRHLVAEGCSVVFSTSGKGLPGRTLELGVAPDLWAELHEDRQLNDRQVTLLGYDVFERPTESLFREYPPDTNSETSSTGPESNEP